MPDKKIFHEGTLAYFDSVAGGLIPCKVMKIDKYKEWGSGIKILIKITGKTPRPYKTGETMWMNQAHVIPKAVFHKSRGKPFHYWTSPYEWKSKR